MPGPTGSAAHYEPNGYKFRDAKNGEMMLVYEGEWKDWLAYRHPDGQWVSLRKATPADWHALGIAISEAHHAPNDVRERRGPAATDARIVTGPKRLVPVRSTQLLAESLFMPDDEAEQK